MISVWTAVASLAAVTALLAIVTAPALLIVASPLMATAAGKLPELPTSICALLSVKNVGATEPPETTKWPVVPALLAVTGTLIWLRQWRRNKRALLNCGFLKEGNP